MFFSFFSSSFFLGNLYGQIPDEPLDTGVEPRLTAADRAMVAKQRKILLDAMFQGVGLRPMNFGLLPGK